MSNPRELPILFNADMVRVLLDGTKSQTRRPIKPQPPAEFCTGDVAAITNGRRWAISRSKFSSDGGGAWPPDTEPGIKPQYQIGDRLYVRETFIAGYDVVDGELQMYDEDGNDLDQKVWYRADLNQSFVWHDEDGFALDNIPWKPSIHMPKWAARIWLEVVDVRVERVNTISREECLKEGLVPPPAKARGMEGWHGDVYGVFKDLWDSIYKNWQENPWVFVYEFKVVKPEVCNG